MAIANLHHFFGALVEQIVDFRLDVALNLRILCDECEHLDEEVCGRRVASNDIF